MSKGPQPLQKSHSHATGRIAPSLLARIPREARLVVEIGCKDGALGAAYKQINPACTYIGMAPSVDPAAEARLDRVIAGNPDSLDLASLLGTEKADVIVYNGVLERLADPVAVIAAHAACLSDTGVIVAQIAHGGHWQAVLRLLEGRPWAEEGAPPPRSFTSQDMANMFEAAGFVVLGLVAAERKDPRQEAFLKAIPPVVAALGGAAQAVAARAGAESFTVIAGRAPAKPLLVQAMMLTPVGAVNDVRVILPGAALASRPGIAFAAKVARADLTLGSRFTDKIFLWHRPVMTRDDAVPKVNAILERGYTLVVEFDDHPERWPEIEANDYLTYRAAHGVQTTTDPLAEMYRQFNPEVTVFPNAVDRLPPLRDKDPETPCRLFFGALNRAQDWAPVMPALNRLLKAFGDRVAVDVLHDQAFFEALETPHKSFTPTSDYDGYRRRLRQADICLMPLAETPFNRMKSDLKFIEAASLGAVALASPVVYAQSLKDGETGMLFNDAESFEARLTMLLSAAALRERLARAAHAYVAGERMLAYQVSTRLSWYESLIARRADLTEDLRARVPELGIR
ncbi:MAG: methyltransferase domain-containing protein [Magnetospiraceae bacterium]